ncbi:MAG: extracellular solute-binding protein [Anaerolineaceae bacterium]|nr:extracellular solute-binding protein [Anaerolineaceae bacterium]
MNEKDRKQRLYVAQQGEKLRKGKISRREFLQRAAAAGFGMSAAGLMRMEFPRMAAPLRQGGAGVNFSDEQIAWLKEVGGRFAGQTVRIASESTAPSQIISDLATNPDDPNSFQNLTGIQVIWEQTPLDQVLSKITQDTATESASNDIYYLDQAWVGRFVNDTVDPSERLADGSDLNMPDFMFEDFVPELLPALASYQGRLVGLPFDIPIFIYMYRKDVYDQLGLSPATNMEEFLNAVKTIDEAGLKNEDGSDIRGYIGQWKSGHYALQCDWTAWLWSHGGSHTNADGVATINDEQGLAGAAYMMELAKYNPSGSTTWDWGGQGDAMVQGLGANVISWSEFFPGTDNPDTSKTVGLWETADLPMEASKRSKDECGFDETPAIGHQGGSCMALSKYSEVSDAAWMFLQYATSSPVQIAAATSSNTPIRLSAFESDVVKAKAMVTAGTTRHFPAALKVIQTRMGTEPHFPGWASASGTGGPIPTELGLMTTGATDIKSALDNINQYINDAINEE